VFIKYKAEVSSRVSGGERGVVDFGKLFAETNEEKFGGVLLYVRDSFKATEVHMKSRYGEHVWCQIGELTLGVIYRSNNVRLSVKITIIIC